MFKRLIFTGVDDNVYLERLSQISKKYPWVEWGFLWDGDPKFTKNGYPSSGLLNMMATTIYQADHKVRTSVHVCKDSCLQIINNEARSVIVDYDSNSCPVPLDPFFRSQITRLQFNTAKLEPAEANPRAMDRGVLRWFFPQMETTIQWDSPYGHKMLEMKEWYFTWNRSIIFDKSFGKGVLPSEWPHWRKFGKEEQYIVSDANLLIYAGGLGPDNIETEFPKIREASGGAYFAIDMESGIKSPQGIIDMAKVEAVIEYCKHQIGK